MLCPQLNNDKLKGWSDVLHWAGCTKGHWLIILDNAEEAVKVRSIATGAHCTRRRCHSAWDIGGVGEGMREET